ncbi:MAG: YggS family pyridoxal phosphate-dependent enzyme [Treponema sp.]|nr:YggS family pyridoxal phosphate-dependent enzyme [Treponema sp.]
MSIAENIFDIEERIQRACGRAGRKRDGITLMAVSKFQPINMVEEAWQAGIRYFGESRVQEGIDKFGRFRVEHPEAVLHLIGSLQRNKAKKAALFFDCIQSVDREELIVELGKSGVREKPLPVLLELHTGEESKSGFSGLDSLFRAAELVLESTVLCPQGLMTMAPFTGDRDAIRASFRMLAGAGAELGRRFPPAENWACLSMGMTNDFEIAIEEGATLLRIGSAIFGERV